MSEPTGPHDVPAGDQSTSARLRDDVHRLLGRLKPAEPSDLNDADRVRRLHETGVRHREWLMAELRRTQSALAASQAHLTRVEQQRALVAAELASAQRELDVLRAATTTTPPPIGGAS